MEEALREEILKLRDGEIYCEIGANKNTVHVAFENKGIKIYVVDKDDYPCNELDDPCVGINFLQGGSDDWSREWFNESDQSFISVLVINKDFERNVRRWKDYVKPKGIIMLNTDTFVDLNYKIDRFENYLKIRL